MPQGRYFNSRCFLLCFLSEFGLAWNLNAGATNKQTSRPLPRAVSVQETNSLKTHFSKIFVHLIFQHAHLPHLSFTLLFFTLSLVSFPPLLSTLLSSHLSNLFANLAISQPIRPSVKVKPLGNTTPASTPTHGVHIYPCPILFFNSTFYLEFRPI